MNLNLKTSKYIGTYPYVHPSWILWFDIYECQHDIVTCNVMKYI
jgi:hypothetical protein